MKCHYEVLEVSRDASLDELKKSYRRLALKYHPDKNPDDRDEAQKLFLQVQNAYEVLSDKRERAWYDLHRDSILKGKDSSGDYKDDTIDIFPFFSTSCFCGYDDSPKGFFTVYNNLFEEIAKQDRPLYDEEIDIPCFGNSKSNYDEVVAPFYMFWLSYCTPRSFCWMETADVRMAGDRRTKRMIEAQNKKIRENARKERNESVRELVSFIKKRDPRVKQHEIEQSRKIKESKDLHRQRLLEKRRQRACEKDRLLQEYQEPEWLTCENLEARLDLLSMENESSDDRGHAEESNETDALFCPACNKLFKNVNTLKNHFNSKKHLDAMESLKSLMNEEERELFVTEEESENSECRIDKKNRRKKKKRKKPPAVESESEKLGESSEEKENQNGVCSNNVRKNTRSPSVEETCVIRTNPTSAKKTEAEDSNNNPVCAQCYCEFTSRNQLFKHLRETNHATVMEAASKKSKQKRKKKAK